MVGLAEYLEDEQLLKLMSWIHDHLKPGGRAIIGQLEAGNPSRPFMDHILEWPLIHRDEEELRELLLSSTFGRQAEITVTSDETGAQLLAVVGKPQ